MFFQFICSYYTRFFLLCTIFFVDFVKLFPEIHKDWLTAIFILEADMLHNIKETNYLWHMWKYSGKFYIFSPLLLKIFLSDFSKIKTKFCTCHYCSMWKNSRYEYYICCFTIIAHLWALAYLFINYSLFPLKNRGLWKS